MKNTVKNNAGDQSDLLATPSSTKPITSTHATAAQLAAALGFEEIDETFLRNRVKDGIIPKPVGGLYDINATTLGLLRWYRGRAIVKSDVPAQYANMQAMENALGTNKKAIKWLLKNGAGKAQDAGNRIAPLPVLRRAFDIIALVADGSISGINGLEEWNHQTELAKKLRLESEKMEDEKLLRRGEMMIARDGTFAISQLVADELIWEKRDQPLRAALLAAPKNINRQHRTILAGDTPLPDKIRRCAEVVHAETKAVLEKVRAKKPKQPDLSE